MMQRLWSLAPEELALLADLPDAGRLGLAAQLAYWRQHGRFPDECGSAWGADADRHRKLLIRLAGRGARSARIHTGEGFGHPGTRREPCQPPRSCGHPASEPVEAIQSRRNPGGNR